MLKEDYTPKNLLKGFAIAVPLVFLAYTSGCYVGIDRQLSQMELDDRVMASGLILEKWISKSLTDKILETGVYLAAKKNLQQEDI